MDEALIKRVLPHSVEAEQSVIGSMLMDREAIIAASEIITGADFYQHQYGVMFESMVELFNEGKPVDLVTLQNRLREKDVPPEVSSLDFVRDIMTSVPTSVNVKSYANIVREKAVIIAYPSVLVAFRESAGIIQVSYSLGRFMIEKRREKGGSWEKSHQKRQCLPETGRMTRRRE